MDGFTVLVPVGKLRDARALHLKRASNRSSGCPVYEPFVKVWRLSLGNGAGINDARVCELLVSYQEDG